MSSVTGYTSEKALAIEQASVVDAWLTPSGDLILEQVDGSLVNVGPVAGDLPVTRPAIVSLSGFDKDAEEIIVPDWNVGGNNVNVSGYTAASAEYASAWSPDGNYLALASNGSPYILIYKRSGANGSILTKLTDPATLPSGTPVTSTYAGIAWSPDSRYVAISGSVTPFMTIYKRTAGTDTFVKLADPVSLPPGSSSDVAWSPDGLYLTVVSNVTPYVTIYRRVGDLFTKQTGVVGPATTPSLAQNSCEFSPNGRHLVVSSTSGTPYFWIYKRAGDVFTKLADPSSMPGQVYDCKWSPDGNYLSFATFSTEDIWIYKRSGDTFTKLNTGSFLGTGLVATIAHAWSPDGRYIAVLHNATSPFISVFRKNPDDTFEKMPDLGSSNLNGSARTINWSPEGYLMFVGQTSFPYGVVFKSEFGPIDRAASRVIALP